MSTVRYPFDPIDRLFPFRPTGGFESEPMGVSGVLGLANTSISRYRREGVSVEVADRLAVTLGMHPAQLWPTWFEDAENEPGCVWCCGLLPLSRLHVCSETCRDRLREERKRDAGRRHRWFKRLDRYRETVVILEEVA